MSILKISTATLDISFTYIQIWYNMAARTHDFFCKFGSFSRDNYLIIFCSQGSIGLHCTSRKRGITLQQQVRWRKNKNTGPSWIKVYTSVEQIRWIFGDNPLYTVCYLDALLCVKTTENEHMSKIYVKQIDSC